MRKIWGNISYGFAILMQYFMKGLLFVVELITGVADSIKAFASMIIIITIIGMFMFPFLLIIVFSPIGFTAVAAILLVWMISYIGTASIIKLRKWKYITDHYFIDYAQYYRGNFNKNKSFDEYAKEYDEELNRRYEEQRRREEEARRKRQEAENERWRKFFEENFRGYNQGGYTGGYQSSNGRSTYNPFSQFKTQYESSCDILGVSYNASYSEIKSAYRKLAKKYHPDLSSERNAEEMFKKINNAFDFLSEENVKRYNNL